MKRSSHTILSKPVTRLVEVDLSAIVSGDGKEIEPALKGSLLIGLDPKEGVTIRLKNHRRKLTVSIEKLLEVAVGDTRKSPKNRSFLLGK